MKDAKGYEAYAPKAEPASYSDRGEWPEGMLDGLAQLWAETPDDTDAARVLRNLTSRAADAIKADRERVYYRSWVETEAASIAADIADEYVTEDEAQQSDTVWERIDSAVPVYTYDRERIVSEASLEPDSETHALAGDGAGMDQLNGVIIFQALEEAVWDNLRTIYAEREDAEDDANEFED